MYDYLISEYIKKMTIQDVINYSIKKEIKLTDNEASIIYQYLKKYWEVFYKGNPTKLLEELSTKINPYTFAKIKEIYIEFKNKISY